MMYPDEIWWDQVPGAVRLKEALEEDLCAGRCFWLQGELPWPDEFRSQLKNCLGETDSRISIEFFTAGELEGRQPQELIFQLQPGAEDEYLPSKPLHRFLAEGHVLEHTILWLDGVDSRAHAPWFELSRELARQKEGGLRIICRGDVGKEQFQKVRRYAADQFVTEFDQLLYAMLLSGEKPGSRELKTYYSYLAVGLAGDNVEDIPLLLRDPLALVRAPEACLEEAGLPPVQNLKQIVHEVQMKVLQPRLEGLQEALVDEISRELERLLPFKDDYDKTCSELYDIELRHLIYFRNELNLSEANKKLLDKLYTQRNLLAHRHIVEGGAVIDILQ